MFLFIPLLGFPNFAHADSGLTLFRSAYENRYTWDRDFPGYTATVVVNYAQDTFTGKIKVNPDLSVEVTGIDEDNIRTSVENVLKMEVSHRRRLDFERVHGNKDFSITASEPNGVVVVKELDSEQDSFYRVQNQRIIQVNRTFDNNLSVTVDTLKTTPVTGGYLATEFKTVFRDAQSQAIAEIETVRDTHTQVGAYYLLSSRTIESVDSSQERSEIQMLFQDLRLGAGKAP
jgi:hypothetical protein